MVWGVFYMNGGRINIITNNQSGKIIKVVKAAINNAKICKKPIAGYDKIIQNQPSPNNTQNLYDNWILSKNYPKLYN